MNNELTREHSLGRPMTRGAALNYSTEVASVLRHSNAPQGYESVVDQAP